MRIIGLILLIAAAFTSAQTRVMHIYQKDGIIDTINCIRMDAENGVTFTKTKMRVAVVDSINGIPYRSVIWYCTGRIDSITFNSIDVPPPTGFSKSPAPNQQVGNNVLRPFNHRETMYDARGQSCANDNHRAQRIEHFYSEIALGLSPVYHLISRKCHSFILALSLIF